MPKDKGEVSTLKPKREVNLAAVGIVGAIAGAVSAIAITTLVDKEGGQKIEKQAEDLTTQGVKVIRSFRKIVEELDNLREVGGKALEEGKKETEKYIRG